MMTAVTAASVVSRRQSKYSPASRQPLTLREPDRFGSRLRPAHPAPFDLAGNAARQERSGAHQFRLESVSSASP
jgi:hypothetical protein